MGSLYVRLGLDERVEIEKGLERGESLRRIAFRLGCSVSTVSREVRWGMWVPISESVAYRAYRSPRFTGSWLDARYAVGPAQRGTDARAARSHPPRLFTDDEIVTYVTDGLRRGWSPAMIAGRGIREGIRVSHESIYKWVYAPSQTHKQRWQYLVRGHKNRRHKHGRRVHTSHIPLRVSIHERPDAINQRSEFGHWEGDTVLGAKTDHDGIHTEVERTSKYLMAYKIPDLSATTTAITQLAMFTKLPAHALRSTTLDNGAENHRHYLLNLLAVQVFFADPYSAWQRGTNEHFNGVLRRYLPKGTSLTTLTDQELADIVEEINNRPLKCLNWNTPTETFQQQLQSNQHTNVALLN